MPDVLHTPVFGACSESVESLRKGGQTLFLGKPSRMQECCDRSEQGSDSPLMHRRSSTSLIDWHGHLSSSHPHMVELPCGNMRAAAETVMLDCNIRMGTHVPTRVAKEGAPRAPPSIESSEEA